MSYSERQLQDENCQYWTGKLVYKVYILYKLIFKFLFYSYFNEYEVRDELIKAEEDISDWLVVFMYLSYKLLLKYNSFWYNFL